MSRRRRRIRQRPPVLGAIIDQHRQTPEAWRQVWAEELRAKGEVVE